MEETVPDGITSPSGGDEYALVADLATMAAAIQEALLRRANTRHGTQSERNAGTASLPDGTIWKDTNGDRALWVRDQAQWSQIWPEPLSRMVRAGSFDELLGVPFFNLRWLHEDGSKYQATIRPGTDPEKTSITMLGFLENDVTNAVHFRRNGGVLVYDGNVSRFLPFATDTGSFPATIVGPNNITTIDVSFVPGMFTMRPTVNLTLQTDRPDFYSYSVSGVTTSGFKAHIHRSIAGSFTALIDWHAVQRLAAS